MQPTYIIANNAPTEHVAIDTGKPQYQFLCNLSTGVRDTVHNLITGAFVPLDVPSPLLDDYTSYVAMGGKVLDEQSTSAAEQLSTAKAQKLMEVAQAAQAFIDNAVQDAAPRVERDTYPLQAAEAESWALDSNSPTPLLEGIAAARNIDLNELRQRTLDKSRAWQALCAMVIGQRQAFEDQIKQIHSLEALNVMVIQFGQATDSEQTA
jgi:type II secretory pathway pseudopilin PulG